MPISCNELGLKNSQQSLGYALMAVGVGASALALARFAMSDAAALNVFDWALIGAVGLFGVRRLYVGANIALSLVIDTVGPAGIERADFTLSELLMHRRVWTYRRPDGLLGKIYHRFVPRLVFLTPPRRRLLDGVPMHAALGIVAFILLVYYGRLAAPFAVVVFVSAVGRLLALWYASSGQSNNQPPIEVYEKPEHLSEAGNPIDLYKHVRLAFEKFREKGFQNRILIDQSPAVGVNPRTNECSGNLLIETQPIPLDPDRKVPRIALILDAFGVVLELVGCGMLLFMPVLADAAEQQVWYLLAASISWWFGSAFLMIAQDIHYTFRFRSDVVWLYFDGSYLMNKLAVGGGFAGLPSTEGNSVKSDLHVFIRGARLVTECSPSSSGFWHQLVGSTRPAEESLASSPRYIVSTRADAVFSERLDWLVGNLNVYQDSAHKLRTPDLHTPDMQQMLIAGAQMTHLLNAAAAQGAAQGQASALVQPQPTPQLPNVIAQQRWPGPPLTPPKSHANQPPAPAATPAPHKLPSPASPIVTGQTLANSSSKSVGWPCRNCGRNLKAPIAMAGQSLRCVGCGSQQIVPRSAS